MIKVLSYKAEVKKVVAKAFAEAVAGAPTALFLMLLLHIQSFIFQ